MKSYSTLAFSLLGILISTALPSFTSSTGTTTDVYFECFGNEYKLETDLKSWNDHKAAQSSSDGWLLASIRNPEEDECIKDALNAAGYTDEPDHIWLGSKVSNVATKEWKWTDNDDIINNLPYSNWADGQPPNSGISSPCPVEYSHGEWATQTNCDANRIQMALFKLLKPHNDFFIARTFLDADLNKSPEIRLDYELGQSAANSDIIIQLLDGNCGSTLTPSGVVTVSGGGMKNALHAATIGTDGTPLVTKYFELNIDESKLGGDGLDFCVRVDVRKDSSSMSFVETKITLDLELSATFGVDGIVIEQDREDHEEVSVSGFTARAWKCKNDGNYNEDNSPINPNETLLLCIRSNTPNAVEVRQVRSLTCEQHQTGSNKYSVKAIDGGNIVNNDMTVVSYPTHTSYGRIAVVAMHVQSTFFVDPNPNDMSVFGKVLLKLSNDGGRRRRISYWTREAEEAAGAATNEELDALYEVNIPVVGLKGLEDDSDGDEKSSNTNSLYNAYYDNGGTAATVPSSSNLLLLVLFSVFIIELFFHQ